LKVLVIRQGDRIFASSGTCTHRGCALQFKENRIKCPCHGSSFSNDGRPNGGPAKAALFRYKITLNDQGRMLVDKSKQFGEKQWENAGAFVTVKQA
jgi:cytochrome b6-f complex iron-sulfur subunit